MASPEESMFQEAMSAVDARDLARARDLFTRLLKINQNNTDYWLWMSAMVETARERNYCLSEVLRRDPNNAAARRGMQIAGQATPDEAQVLPPRVQHRNWEADFFGSDTPQKAMAARSLRLTLGIAGGLVLILIVGVGLIWSLSQPKYGVVYSTQESSARVTSTPQPTTTAAVHAASPTFTGPTPLWMQMQATYTPTPLYVNTPHPISESYRIAIRAYGRGDWPGMEKYMLQVVTVQPDAADIYYYMGEASRLQNNFNDALTNYNRAIQINPNFAPAYLGRARLRLMQNATSHEVPLADLLLALQKDPNLLDAYLDLAQLQISDGQYSEALAQLNLAAQHQPGSPLVALYQAEAYLKLNQPEKALERAQRANQLDITLLPAYRVLGEALLANHQDSAAHKALQVYTTYVGDDPQAYILLAQAYDAMDDLENALLAYDQALKIDAKQPEIYRRRGEMYARRKMLDQAVSEFQQALKLDKNNYAVQLDLGTAYLQQKAFRSAYTPLDIAYNLAQTDYERAQAQFWRAQSLEGIQEMNAALRDYKTLVAMPTGTVEAEWISFAATRLSGLVTPSATAVPLKPTDTRVPTATVRPSPTRTPTFTRTVTQTPKP